mgnify:CR=1 FL=1
MIEYLLSYASVLDHVLIYTVLAMSQAILLRAGTFSIGPVAFAAIGAYATAILTTQYQWHPALAMASGVLPPGGREFDVLGLCFRREPSLDPARMQSFHQREFVHIGDPDSALEFRNRWLDRALQIMEDLGLDVRAEVANDPFFGHAGRMLAAPEIILVAPPPIIFGEWGDMIEMGVLDPVKVSRVTLQNAASVASLILITEATVSDVPKNTQLEDAIAAATAGQQGGGRD